MNIHQPLTLLKAKSSLAHRRYRNFAHIKTHILSPYPYIFRILDFHMRVVTGNGLMDSLYTFPEPPSLVFYPNRLIEGYRNFDVAFEPFVLN